MTTDLVAWSSHPKATEAERYAEGRMNCTYAKHKLIIISHLHPKYLFYLPRKPNYKNKKTVIKSFIFFESTKILQTTTK